MRLIDADKLDFSYCDNEFDCIFVVDKAPTIDAVPVRHGHWIDGICGAYKICSVCDQISDFDFDYCPNCGAKMDEVSE